MVCVCLFVGRKEAESFHDLIARQPTLLRLLPSIGFDIETGMDFICLGGALLSFVAMVSRDQRNCVVFAVLWMFYLSLFQVLFEHTMTSEAKKHRYTVRSSSG